MNEQPGIDAANLTSALMELVKAAKMIADAADSLRKDLEGRGWSPTAAEAAALSWLQTKWMSI